MNRTSITYRHILNRIAGSAVAAGLLLCQGAQAQTIPNPSFEANSFSVAPGYISENAPITGWVTDYDSGAGLNPAGGSSQFANNGAIPDGNNVAFITGWTSLSTTITGLTPGRTYKVTFRANSGTGQAPTLRVTIGTDEVLALAVYPVGETRPYAYLAFEFTATAATASMGLLNESENWSDAILIDDFKIAESDGRWSVGPWTGDADSGVDASFVYTHAYNLGSSANATINGVTFTGVAGTNPSVPERFSTTQMGNVFTGDANNITGGSAAMAQDFTYNGANVVAGTYQSITLRGLTPGTEYVLSAYSVGWESPSPTVRWATLAVGDDRLTFNQDQFDNNNGIRLSYRYTADETGTATLNIAPVNPVNMSIHIYGFSNREAVSRNVAPEIVLQPSNVTIAQGLPAQFTVAASGFPSPTYQWRFNGVDIAGATTATNVISQASIQNAGAYDVIVSNPLGSVTSAVARLVVGLPMVNSSFEADSFESWPGYSGDNPGSANTPPGPNVPITGWTQSSVAGSGINPIATGEAPFANNGRVPHGRQVAFIQADSTLSQTVSGFTVGSQYYLHYYENARSGGTPALAVTLGGNTLVPERTVPSAGGANPYRAVFSDVFTASAPSLELTFIKSNPLGGDTTVLIDNPAFVEVLPGTAPSIVRQPASRLVSAGTLAEFSAQFIGSLPATFQWLKNGTPLAGATSATLRFESAQAADEADYSVVISNASGSATSAVARLTVALPGVFGTGIGTNGQLLGAGEVDPHYTLVSSADFDWPGPEAYVVNDGWPIQAGVWLLNGPDSKWIAPQADQSGAAGNAEGDYVYRTTFNLTGFDPSRIHLVGGWAVDNAGTDIVVNGTSTGITSPGFGQMTPFTITTGLVAGENVLEFKVNNAPATPNPTALRVDLKAILAPVVTEELAITRDGANVSITWTGQRLQSATNVNGPWTDIEGAAKPYTTQAGANQMFFRAAQ
jgi:hypothetical protein